MRCWSPTWILGFALGVGALAGRDVRGDGNPSDPFVGTWSFAVGTVFTAQCDAGTKPGEIGGDTLAIRAVDASTVELDLGCHCPLLLVVEGSTATLTGAPQRCDLVISGASVDMSVSTLSISLNATGDLTFDLASHAAQVRYPQGLVECTGASSQATLTKVSVTAPECGPDDHAVGVIPYGPQRTIPCYLMAGTEGVEIAMQQENDYACSYQSGDAGEGRWALPQATRHAIECSSRAPGQAPVYNDLSFCRVDGGRFKPLTRDPADVANFYAVLNLAARPDDGPAPCPNGSTLTKRYLHNETDPGAGNIAGGRLGPNVVESTLTGSSTKNAALLYFCYFRAADPGQEVMSDFPSLGFPYAVFHAFEGPQPAWVTLKRWVFTDDESRDNQDVQIAASDATVLATFGTVIETPTNGTTFNMALVR